MLRESEQRNWRLPYSINSEEVGIQIVFVEDWRLKWKRTFVHSTRQGINSKVAFTFGDVSIDNQQKFQ